MRYRAMFITGFAVGFVVGARAGRERYDQIVTYTKKVAGHPAVQKTTQTVTVKTTEYAKTAMSKAPDFAKTATDKIPSLLRGKGGGGAADDVTADGHLVYPADDAEASVNGTRYNAE